MTKRTYYVDLPKFPETFKEGEPEWQNVDSFKSLREAENYLKKIGELNKDILVYSLQ